MPEKLLVKIRFNTNYREDSIRLRSGSNYK
jgi:hypothetical protein